MISLWDTHYKDFASVQLLNPRGWIFSVKEVDGDRWWWLAMTGTMYIGGGWASSETEGLNLARAAISGRTHAG